MFFHDCLYLEPKLFPSSGITEMIFKRMVFEEQFSVFFKKQYLPKKEKTAAQKDNVLLF